MRDLRLAVRTLRAAPIVTAVAVLSLALGIGANTSIFSLVNGLLLRALPVVEPERLVTLSGGASFNEGSAATWTYPIWNQIRERADVFDGAVAWQAGVPWHVTRDGETRTVDGTYVSGAYFTTLGVPAVAGRTFNAADDVRGADPVAIISHRFWRRHFNESASAIGAPLVIERTAFTIVGVAPPGFDGIEVGRSFDVALPIAAEPLVHGKDSYLDAGAYFLAVMLRLKHGQTIDSAAAALRALQPAIRETTLPADRPELQPGYLNLPFTLVSTGPSRLRQRYEQPLVIAQTAVALVLLVACLNIANLQVARAIARRHELALRLALGASRWRLARQLLMEGLVLSGMGAAIGLLLATWSSQVLVAQLSTWRNRVFLETPLDWRVLTFTAVATSAVAVLFGLAPAFRAHRVVPMDVLKEQGRTSSSSAGMRLSSGLVIVQVALSLVLVGAAGLFVRTFAHLATRSLGFDADRVLVVNVDAAHAAFDATNRAPFYDRLVSAIRAVAGVSNAAGSLSTPMGIGSVGFPIVEVPNAPALPLTERKAVSHFVMPGWFATYRTPIRAGRDVNDRDVKTSPAVMLVNETFARRFFPDGDAVGRSVRLAIGDRGETPIGSRAIIGVTGDAVSASLRSDIPPSMFVPVAQWDWPMPLPPVFSLSARSSTLSPAQLARSVTAALTTVAPALDFTFTPHSLTEQIEGSLVQERLLAILAGFFGVLALLLAGLGLYGVTSHAVGRRRTEIGIRMALGASPGGVVGLVLWRVMVLVGIGVAVGTGVSVWVTTFVTTLLYGLQPRDPLNLVGAAIVLGGVAALAAWPPARRASRIDPADVLRDR